jgi:hypothetical protein
MRRMHTRLPALLFALAACADDPATNGVGAESVPTDNLPDETFVFSPEPGTSVPRERARRRLDLDQLDRSFRVVSGFGWTRRAGNNEINRLDELAATLGKPDFIENVDEDLSPSPMFLKFLDDAARSVCDRWMGWDAQLPLEERTFYVTVEPDVPYSEDTSGSRANVRALLLRAHGRHTDSGDPVLDRWTALLSAAETQELQPAQGWRAVCVAALTHPDFYLY